MGILRKVFGPSKDEIWQQLCDEIHGEFISKGACQNDKKVLAHVREWTITLDTYTASTGKNEFTYTRMRAPYVNRDGFRFTIYRKTFLSSFGTFLGMQDIKVGGPTFHNLGPLFGVASYIDKHDIECGYPQFDEDFIIRGNNEDKVKLLFKNLQIRELIEAQPHFYLQVKDDEGWFGTHFPEGVDELYFQVTGVIKDLDKLKKLYELFAEILNTLCHIGSAYESDPHLEL